MSKLTIGIVDYGVGNHASVQQSLYHLGFRCRVSGEPSVLDACQLLLLPGVGAFRLAMQALTLKSLDQFLIEQAGQQKPILGICLGMQLLTNASYEDGYTLGLGLIPGETTPLGSLRWHVGWNTIEQVVDDPFFQHNSNATLFFNHAYIYFGPKEYQICRTLLGDTYFPSIIRRNKIVGMQFHPEKSQGAGHVFLKQAINGLCNA